MNSPPNGLTAGDPQQIRQAATVMLVRSGDGGVEVYLLERVSTMVFAPGMTVFPGGGVEPADRQPSGRWTGPDPGEWARPFGDDEPVDAKAVVAAAVRELTEETGVLLGDSGELPGNLLRPWARWLTPPGNTRRYDTIFLLAALPAGAEPTVTTTEASVGRWWRPGDALAAAACGQLAMLPPTLVMLGELDRFTSVAELMAADRSQAEVTPTLSSGRNGTLLITMGERSYEVADPATRPAPTDDRTET